MERNEQKRLVVKIGSSTITNGGSNLDKFFMSDIARQVAMIRHDFNYQVAIVSSGAIVSGRLEIPELGQDIVDMKTASMVGQNKLMNAWTEALNTQGTKVVGQALYTDQDLAQAPPTLLRVLEFGVAIINTNDAVADWEIRQMSVTADNDRLAGFVAKAIKADTLALLTDVDGVLDEQGQRLPFVDRIEDIEDLIRGKSNVGTGGMGVKIMVAKSAAQAGIKTVIANAREEDIILKIVKGENAGTRFLSGYMLY